MLAISAPPPLPHLLSRVDPIIPPSMISPQNGLPLDSPSPTTKPKLSLKTSDLAPTFHGSINRPVGISTNTTSTPTTLNTFNNTFDLTYRPSPVSAQASPGFQPGPGLRPSSPASKKSGRPYELNLPFGVYPILRNSQLPRDTLRSSASVSPRVSGRRMFFPAPKKVTFRADLEDEIVTKRYLMRHVDLSSSEDDGSVSDAGEHTSTSSDEEGHHDREVNILVDEFSVRGRKKRKSMAVSPHPPIEGSPATEARSGSSSSRRSKRKRRRWEWTLESKMAKESTMAEESQNVHEDDTAHIDRRTPSPAEETTQESISQSDET